MKAVRIVLGMAGFIMCSYGMYSAIAYASRIWYSFFVPGLTLFLWCVNDIMRISDHRTRKEIIIHYILFVIAAGLIEITGRMILHLWDYPRLSIPMQVLHVFMIGYPFAFFSIRESYILIRRFFSAAISLPAATLANAFIHEIPNTYAWEWVYTIPYVRFEIWKINIVVIIGWIILILIPVYSGSLVQTLLTVNPFHRWIHSSIVKKNFRKTKNYKYH